MRANKSLIKLSVAAAAALAASAVSARAALILTETTTAGSTINSGDAAYDNVLVTITGLNGLDSDTNGVGTYASLGTLSGTWTVTGGSIYLQGKTTTYQAASDNAGSGQDQTYSNNVGEAPRSYVNFDSIVAGDFASTTATQATKVNSTSTVTTSALTGTWYTSTPTDRLDTNTTATIDASTNRNVLADFWITHGATISFAGNYISYGQNPGTYPAAMGPANPTMSIANSGTSGSTLGTVITAGNHQGYWTSGGTNTGGSTGQQVWSNGSSADSAATAGAQTGNVQITGTMLTPNPDGTTTAYVLVDLQAGGKELGAAQGGNAATTTADITQALNDLITNSGFQVDSDLSLTEGTNNTALFDKVKGCYMGPGGTADPFAVWDALVEIPISGLGSTAPSSMYVNFDFSGYTPNSDGDAISVARLAVVPEPASLALLSLAVVPMLARRRRRTSI